MFIIIIIVLLINYYYYYSIYIYLFIFMTVIISNKTFINNVILKNCIIKFMHVTSITLIKKIIIHNYKFYGKTLIQSKTKKKQITSFFQKSEPKLKLKKIRGLSWYFWIKMKTKRVIPNFLYKLVKTLYLFLYDNKK